MHIDREWAQAGPFEGLIASGFLTLSIAWWLFLRLGLVSDSMYVGVGIDELRWLHPIRPNDTLSLRVEVVDKSTATKKDRGRVTFQHTLCNQRSKPVMAYKTINLIYSKTHSANGSK